MTWVPAVSQNQSSSRGMSDGQTVSAAKRADCSEVFSTLSISFSSFSIPISSDSMTGSISVSIVSVDVSLSRGAVRQHWGSSSNSHSHGFGIVIKPCFVVQLHTCLPVGLKRFQDPFFLRCLWPVKPKTTVQSSRKDHFRNLPFSEKNKNHCRFFAVQELYTFKYIYRKLTRILFF